jgi:hypothetical protein
MHSTSTKSCYLANLLWLLNRWMGTFMCLVQRKQRLGVYCRTAEPADVLLFDSRVQMANSCYTNRFEEAKKQSRQPVKDDCSDC